jgi:hypothetical protein
MFIKFGRNYYRKSFIFFLLKNEYLRLNGNNFKSGFGGGRLEGMDSIDRAGNSSNFSLKLLAFDFS